MLDRSSCWLLKMPCARSLWSLQKWPIGRSLLWSQSCYSTCHRCYCVSLCKWCLWRFSQLQFVLSYYALADSPHLDTLLVQTSLGSYVLSVSPNPCQGHRGVALECSQFGDTKDEHLLYANETFHTDTEISLVTVRRYTLVCNVNFFEWYGCV